MFRSVIVAAFVAATALGAAPGALASTSAMPTETLTATVASAGPEGYKLKLTDDGDAAGLLNLTECGEGSSVSYFCSGTAKIPSLNAEGRVRIRWHCPPDKPCAGQAHGLIKNNGNVLATLASRAWDRSCRSVSRRPLRRCSGSG
jgi:hypothetical protein